MSQKVCIFGGQYGSEGKGCVSEFYARLYKAEGTPIVAFAESAPNAGHANTLIKTRLMPSCSIWADYVLIGPDAVIDPQVLVADMVKIREVGGKATNCLKVIIHERAAWFHSTDTYLEEDLVKRISSTGTGSGIGRLQKYIWRKPEAVVAAHKSELIDKSVFDIEILSPHEWMCCVQMLSKVSWIVECSQGVLLDPNWGHYPYCTSRNTSPRVVVERSGLGHLGSWTYAGVYRYHPVRTGGPSGPTAEAELDWTVDLSVPPEVTAVTKRVRRVFGYSHREAQLSMSLARPHIVFWTHVDYLKLDMLNFAQRVDFKSRVGPKHGDHVPDQQYASSRPGQFLPLPH